LQSGIATEPSPDTRSHVTIQDLTPFSPGFFPPPQSGQALAFFFFMAFSLF
jgi:hypothetical protein